MLHASSLIQPRDCLMLPKFAYCYRSQSYFSCDSLSFRSFNSNICSVIVSTVTSKFTVRSASDLSLLLKFRFYLSYFVVVLHLCDSSLCRQMHLDCFNMCNAMLRIASGAHLQFNYVHVSDTVHVLYV